MALLVLLLSSLVSAAAPAPAPARAEPRDSGARVDGVKVLASGLFERVQLDRAGLPPVLDDKFRLETATVTAAVGTMFGYRFELQGAPKGAEVGLKVVTIFPKPGVHDPESGKLGVREEGVGTFKIGEVAFQGFRIGKTWEAVPGKWVFELWRGKRRLHRRSFTLVEPPSR